MTVRARCLAGALLLCASGCGSSKPAGANGIGGAGGAGGTAGASAGGASGFHTDDAADLIDGARLKFPRWVTADGLSIGQGTIWDSGRSELCTFQRATDAKLRCMPAPGGYDIKQFADAGCTEPLFSTNGATTPVSPYAVFDRSSTGCADDALLEVRPLLEPFGGTVVYELSGAACVAKAASARDDLHRTGAVLAPAMFVGATSHRVGVAGEAPSDGLSLILLDADDGASMKLSFSEDETGQPCTPQTTNDGQLRCVPAARYRSLAGPEWGQADCGGAGVAAELRCAPKASKLAIDYPVTCPRRPHFHDAGSGWTGTSVYRMDPMLGCVGVPATGSSYVELGPEKAPSDFTGLMLQIEGRARLSAPHYASVRATLATKTLRMPVATSAYDAATGELCTFSKGPDGRTRCLPALLATAFRDEACTDPIGVDVNSDGCGGESPRKYLAVGNEVYTRGARLGGPPAQAFIISTTGACQGAASFTIDALAYYEAGAPVTFDFVEGTATRAMP